MTYDCPECGKPLLEIDTGCGKFHCVNPVCKFQYLDVKTRQEYRKTVKFEKPARYAPSLDDKLKMILVELAIEKALFETGNSLLFVKVKNILFSDYGISIFDCMDHPKYLRNTLDKLVDTKTRTRIINSIKNILEEFTYYKLVKDFLNDLES